MAANNQFKDSVFTSLFSDPARLLDLYNAIRGTAFTDLSALTINTIPDVLFLNRRNDISFTIGNKLVVLMEHQSTVNDNMPLRLLLYIARLYERIIEPRAVYRRRLIKLPRPEFIVLYNGTENRPKEEIMRLSSAFEQAGDDPARLDLTVQILNINKGANLDLERKCAALDGYATFIAKVRDFEGRGEPLEDAIKQAVQFCVDRGILKDYLESHSSEVINMLMTEFNLDDALSVSKEEGFEEGREEGGFFVLDLVKQGLSPEEIEARLTASVHSANTGSV
jgi:hypothetical protein